MAGSHRSDAPSRRRLVLALASLLLVALAVAAPAPAATRTEVFGYTSGEQSWTVPAGVQSVAVTAVGSRGGYERGGRGARGRPPERPPRLAGPGVRGANPG